MGKVSRNGGIFLRVFYTDERPLKSISRWVFFRCSGDGDLSSSGWWWIFDKARFRK